MHKLKIEQVAKDWYPKLSIDGVELKGVREYRLSQGTDEPQTLTLTMLVKLETKA